MTTPLPQDNRLKKALACRAVPHMSRHKTENKEMSAQWGMSSRSVSIGLDKDQDGFKRQRVKLVSEVEWQPAKD